MEGHDGRRLAQQRSHPHRLRRLSRGQLGREVAEHLQRIEQDATARGLGYRSEVRQGRPSDCLLAFCREVDCDVVVIGAPRPKGAAGLRSRLDLESAARGLPIPLLIAPYPHA